MRKYTGYLLDGESTMRVLSCVAVGKKSSGEIVYSECDENKNVISDRQFIRTEYKGWTIFIEA